MVFRDAPMKRLSDRCRTIFLRSPAHLLPATSVLLVVLLSTISFFLPANSSSSTTSPSRQLASSVQRIYDSLGIPYEDEFGLQSENDTISIDEGETGLDRKVVTNTVRPGDTINGILTASGLSRREASEFARKLKGAHAVKGFVPGRSYELETAPDGSFSSLSWRQNLTSVLHLEKEEGTGELTVWLETLQPETRVATLQGTVSSSLEEEMRLHGRPKLAAAIRSIFSSRPGFVHKNLKDAAYRILYEEQWLEGRSISTGKILAVEITESNRRMRAYRYTDAGGRSAYYDERGRAVQRGGAIIEPCNYNRISSTFGYRVHPIRRTRHFHGGVDFAAPAGTPVRAVADGRVIFRGRKGGAGNMVTIAHGKNMHTQYLHLSRFSPAGAFGRRVQQGDVIGYVGSTGSSTGPHLDFRVIMNGKPKDPLAALRSNAPERHLAKAEFPELLARISAYRSQLDNRLFRVASISDRPAVLL